MSVNFLTYFFMILDEDLDDLDDDDLDEDDDIEEDDFEHQESLDSEEELEPLAANKKRVVKRKRKVKLAGQILEFGFEKNLMLVCPNFTGITYLQFFFG